MSISPTSKINGASLDGLSPPDAAASSKVRLPAAASNSSTGLTPRKAAGASAADVGAALAPQHAELQPARLPSASAGAESASSFPTDAPHASVLMAGHLAAELVTGLNDRLTGLKADVQAASPELKKQFSLAHDVVASSLTTLRQQAEGSTGAVHELENALGALEAALAKVAEKCEPKDQSILNALKSGLCLRVDVMRALQQSSAALAPPMLPTLGAASFPPPQPHTGRPG